MTTWQEVNAARRQARRDARVAAVKAYEASGWSLPRVAREFRWSARRLERYLDHIDRHDLVAALMTHTGPVR